MLYNLIQDNSVDGSGTTINLSDRITLINCIGRNNSATGVNGYGLTVQSSSSIFIDNCRYYGNDNDGCAFISNSDSKITNSDFSDNADKGMHIQSTGQLEVNNCTFNSNTTYGLNITQSGDDPELSRITVANSFMSQNGSDGINLSSDRVLITGCVIEENTGRGLRAYYGTPNDVAITGCSIRANVLSGLEFDNCSNLFISGNRIFDDQTTATQDYGIKENAGNGSNVIIGNVLYGNVTGQATLQSGTVAKANSGITDQN